MDAYTYSQDGQIRGPYALELILREIDAGRLTHSSVITSTRTGVMMSVGDAVLAEAEHGPQKHERDRALLIKRLRSYGWIILVLGWVALAFAIHAVVNMVHVTGSLSSVFSISPFLPGLGCFFMGLVLQALAVLVERE